MKKLILILLVLILASCGSRKTETTKVKTVIDSTKTEQLTDSIIVLQKEIETLKKVRKSNDFLFSIIPSKTDTIIREVKVVDNSGNKITTPFYPSDSLIFKSNSKLQKEVKKLENQIDVLAFYKRKYEESLTHKTKEKQKETEKKNTNWWLFFIGLVFGFILNQLFFKNK